MRRFSSTGIYVFFIHILDEMGFVTQVIFLQHFLKLIKILVFSAPAPLLFDHISAEQIDFGDNGNILG
jgi:hypothetical protein